MSTEFALPPRFGLKAGSITPVVASNANTRLRTTSSAVLENVAAGLTDVNVPTATILLPIWVIPWTLPSITCGVVFAGFVETTLVPWSALTAWSVARPGPPGRALLPRRVPTARRFEAAFTFPPLRLLHPERRLRGR